MEEARRKQRKKARKDLAMNSMIEQQKGEEKQEILPEELEIQFTGKKLSDRQRERRGNSDHPRRRVGTMKLMMSRD